MTSKQAMKIGKTKILKATLVAVIILIAIDFIMETKGDFGNGLLFFMESMSNIHLVAILSILFGLTFIFGRKAGKEIILDKKNFKLLAIKYSIAIIIGIVIYAAIIGIYKSKNSFAKNFLHELSIYFVMPLIKFGSLSLIPMLPIWLWATNQMRLAIDKEIK